MKKIRVVLSMTALLLAFGAALASNFSDDIDAFEYQASTERCVLHSTDPTCSPTPAATPCMVGSVQLRQNNIVANECGPELYKP